MRPSMLPALLAGCALAAALFAAAAAQPSPHSPPKAAMLLPGSANDQSWNTLGYSGLMKIKSEGFVTAYSENVPDSDDVSAMQDYARQGYRIVLGHSGRFLSAAEQVAPDYPDVQFIIGGGAAGQAPNVMSIDYDNAQFGCQLGVLAARMSRTGKVGGVYGLQGLPNIVAQAGGFRICAKRTNPRIVVTIVYVKDMEDAAAAKEAALSLIGNGADVLTGKLNAAQNGLVEAAAEKGVYVTGRSLDASPQARKVILTDVIEHWDDMYGAAAAKVKAGTLSGDFVKYGYATARQTTGAELEYSQGAMFNPVVPAAVAREIQDMSRAVRRRQPAGRADRLGRRRRIALKRMPAPGVPLLEMRAIVKSYGAVRANDGIDLDVRAGEIVGLLGENGSGKSTLMRVLFGMVRPDSGGIVFKGCELSDHDPRAAAARGIGMIHQHFALVDAMSVVENVMLGWDAAGRWLRRAEIAARVRAVSARLRLDLDPAARVSGLSLGQRQRLEILKAVIRGVDLLILDEPTSNLSPPEIEGLLAVLRQLRDEGKGLVFISHKMSEVRALCDQVVVLRDGRLIGKRRVGDADERTLADMMIGRERAVDLHRTNGKPHGRTVLEVCGLHARAAGGCGLRGIDLALHAGEVLAVCGIDGNGQAELVEALCGTAPGTAGRVRLDGVDITRLGVAARVRAGIATIPADRAGTSLVQEMNLAENLMLRDSAAEPHSSAGFLRPARSAAAAARAIDAYRIRAAGPQVLARQLSGGNQQKLVVARELARRPKLLLACQATWGLDPGAAHFVREQMLALRDAGGAVLYLSSDLEEVLALGDRIGVLFAGRLVETVALADVDLARIGLLMAGAAPGRTRAA